MNWRLIWRQLKDFGFDLLIIILADLIIAFPVMLAWNAVVPVISKLPELGYWQIFSLMFLGMILKNIARGK